MAKRVFSLAVAAWAAICILGSFTAGPPAAGLPDPGRVIGEMQQYRIGAHDSLIELARRFDLGFNAITAANPGVDPMIPPEGTLIEVPTAWILPDVPISAGIVVNLAEFRLYFFPDKSTGPVLTFPLGIGDEGRDTPVGSYTVVEKIVAPAWHVPESIRSQSPELPKVVPAGPDNPLGSHALRLSLTSILIHGTNRPWGIGRRSSHGCLRLYPEDIVTLFGLVPVGTKVEIVAQPIKVGVRGARVYLEAHPDQSEQGGVTRAMHLLAEKQLLVWTDFAKVSRAMEERRGVPVDVTAADSWGP